MERRHGITMRNYKIYYYAKKNEKEHVICCSCSISWSDSSFEMGLQCSLESFEEWAQSVMKCII